MDQWNGKNRQYWIAEQMNGKNGLRKAEQMDQWNRNTKNGEYWIAEQMNEKNGLRIAEQMDQWNTKNTE